MSTYYVVVDEERASVPGIVRRTERVRAGSEPRAREIALDRVGKDWRQADIPASAVIVGLACPVYLRKTPMIPWHNGLVGQPCVGHCGQIVPASVR